MAKLCVGPLLIIGADIGGPLALPLHRPRSSLPIDRRTGAGGLSIGLQEVRM
jgi:hypothetical protein